MFLNFFFLGKGLISRYPSLYFATKTDPMFRSILVAQLLRTAKLVACVMTNMFSNPLFGQNLPLLYAFPSLCYILPQPIFRFNFYLPIIYNWVYLQYGVLLWTDGSMLSKKLVHSWIRIVLVQTNVDQVLKLQCHGVSQLLVLKIKKRNLII